MGLLLTMVTMEVKVASSQMYGYCENVVFGFPLPIQYARPTYSHESVLPDPPGAIVFADCVWPEAPGQGAIIWLNVVANWMLYILLMYSVLNLIPRKDTRRDRKIFIYGFILFVLIIGYFIWYTNYRNEITIIN